MEVMNLIRSWICLTKDMLQASGMAGTIISILADVNLFWVSSWHVHTHLLMTRILAVKNLPNASIA